MKNECEVLMLNSEGKYSRPCPDRPKHEHEGRTFCGHHSPLSKRKAVRAYVFKETSVQSSNKSEETSGNQ